MAVACFAPFLIIAALWASGSFQVRYAAGFAEKDLIREHWSPMSRVALMKSGAPKESWHCMPGISSRNPPRPPFEKGSCEKIRPPLEKDPSVVQGEGEIHVAKTGGRYRTTRHSLEFRQATPAI
jgi:hypothetical protein